MDFGFIANPDITTLHNVNNHFRDNMKLLHFNRCLNRACHNLCKENYIPPAVTRLLGLGLNFCISDRHPNKDLTESFTRFRNEVRTKFFCLEHQGDNDDNDYNPKLYVKNPRWNPEAFPTPREVESAMDRFTLAVKKSIADHHYSLRPNILRHELALLRKVCANKQIIVLQTDKNLGPAIMDTSTYVHQCLTEHLLNERNYARLAPDQARCQRTEIRNNIYMFLEKYNEDLNDSERTYFKRSFQNLKTIGERKSQFYGLPKVHKEELSLRPVVSTSGTAIEILSRFIDSKLQEVVRLCPCYLQDSWQLLGDLSKLGKLPPNARLFSVDAVGMYVNIDTEHAVATLRKWFALHKAKGQLPKDYPVELVVQGTRLVMTNNVFDFDDVSFQQLNGTAMGTSMACMYATIYYSYHEETAIIPKKDELGIVFFRRFIDDGFVIQLMTPGVHARLVHIFNSFGEKGKRLQWTSTSPSNTVNFLDLGLYIDKDGFIKSRTYEKAMNLHLYIPHHSAHSPSVLKSLIHGQLRRFWLQNSNKNDYVVFVYRFLNHLVNRGYDRDELKPLFLEASDKLGPNLLDECLARKRANRDESLVFFHLQYHPDQVPKSLIQSHFHRECAKELREARSAYDTTAKLNLKRLIIAQSRAPNLRDRLCRSTLRLPDGQRVSNHISLFKGPCQQLGNSLEQPL
jgi:hypothetical protein